MLKSLLGDTVRFYKNHLFQLIKITLPFLVFLELFEIWHAALYDDKSSRYAEFLITIFVNMAIYPLYMAAVIFYVASEISGRAGDIFSAWQSAMRCWVPMFTLYIFLTLIVAMGFLFFIIPGVILMGRLAFAEFNVMLSQQNPMNAMKESWHQTEKHFWEIIAGFFVITVVIYVPYYLLAGLIAQANIAIPYVTNIISIIISIASLVYIVFAYRVYYLVGHGK